VAGRLRSYTAFMFRLLDHPWINRAGNFAFVASVLLGTWRLVNGQRLLAWWVTALLVAGVGLMAAVHLPRLMHYVRTAPPFSRARVRRNDPISSHPASPSPPIAELSLVRSELEEVQARIQIFRLGGAAVVLPTGYALPVGRWEKQKETIAQFPALYSTVDAAYRKIQSVNYQWAWRRENATGKIGVNYEADGIEELDSLVGAAAHALASWIQTEPTGTTVVSLREYLRIGRGMNTPGVSGAIVANLYETSFDQWLTEVREFLSKNIPEHVGPFAGRQIGAWQSAGPVRIVHPTRGDLPALLGHLEEVIKSL
jgi:hypothetical protein